MNQAIKKSYFMYGEIKNNFTTNNSEKKREKTREYLQSLEAFVKYIQRN